MYIGEYMSTNVITVDGDTLIHDADKIMRDHKIRRLPVVDKGRLVGMVTQDRIREATTTPATSLSIWEINYLLAKMKVKDVMDKDVVTVTPNTTVEEAVVMAQKYDIREFPVMEGSTLVGIVTITDGYKITTQAFGFGQPGVRLHIFDCCKTGSLAEVIDIVNNSGARVFSLFHVTPPRVGREDCIIHLDSEDAVQIISELKSKGYHVEKRAS